MKNPLRILACREAEPLMEAVRDPSSVEVDYYDQSEGEIVEKIACMQPDAVILSLFAPQIDAVEAVRAYRSLYADPFAYFAVMCPFVTVRLRNELDECGVNRLICRPYQERDFTEMLCEVAGIKTTTHALMKNAGIQAIHKIHHHHGVSRVADSDEMERAIEGIFQELGVVCSGVGYDYLKRAVMLAVSGENGFCSVTKQIYPAVGNEFGATPSCVERRIRLAISEAWRSQGGTMMAVYFGHTVDNLRGKPSNCEFIAMLADRIRLDMTCHTASRHEQAIHE